MAARRRPRGVIERRPSGSLRVSVYAGTDPLTGRRHYLREAVPPGPDEDKLAEAVRVKLVNRVNERRHPKTNATVSQMLDRYLERLTVERTTMARYRQVIEHHIRPLIGKVKAGAVDGDILDSLYGELRRCRRHCTRRRGQIDHRTPRPHECDDRCRPHVCEPLGEGSIRKAHYVLTDAFAGALRWGWITVNPMDQAVAPALARANPNPPSADEAAQILTQAWQQDPEFGVQVWLSMVLGARRGEICAIRWRHLDLDNGVLHLSKAIAQDGGDIWEKDTKTHQDRRIALDPDTVELLTEHWERWVARAATLDIDASRDAFVFSLSPEESTPIKPTTMTSRYRRLVRSLGIQTHLHALRHYSATELIAAGTDIRTVAGRLGHGGGGSTTLRVYAAWLSEADQRAAASLVTRLPKRPETTTRAEIAKTDPKAPYEKIAHSVYQRIIAGDLAPGDFAPSAHSLATANHVSTGTAHRALELLKTWSVVSQTSRGRRPVILEPATPTPASLPEAATPKPEPSRREELLQLRLLHLGTEVRTFSAEADPHDAEHLRRLIVAAARRHAGHVDVDVAEYELEVRRVENPELLTNFVIL